MILSSSQLSVKVTAARAPQRRAKQRLRRKAVQTHAADKAAAVTDKEADDIASAAANGASADPYDTIEITTPAGQPSRQQTVSRDQESNTKPDEPLSTPPSEKRSAADRLMQLATGNKDDTQPKYRPQGAKARARRRTLNALLPFKWQGGIRSVLDRVPADTFSYAVSTFSIAAAALIGGTAAYFAEPWLKHVIIQLFHAAAPEARVAQELTFETQYLGAISFLTAVLYANTFGLCFAAQREIVTALSKEVFALELLLQELFIQIPEPHLRWRVIKHIKRYTDEELQARDIDSPFKQNGAVVGVFNALYDLRDKEEKDVSKMADYAEQLASSNSERGALTSQLLPSLHWVMLTALTCLIMIAFLLYDSNFVGTVDENRHIFAVLSAAFISVLWVLKDISAPMDGLYSVRDPLENRLGFVRWQMENILADPTIKLSIQGSQDGDQQVDEDTDEPKRVASLGSGQQAAVSAVTGATIDGSSGGSSSS